MGDGRLLANEAGEQVAAFGSVVAPGFSRENTNTAFDATNALLEVGRAGTSFVAGSAPAIMAAERGAIAPDPLLEQMMQEEREREVLRAEGRLILDATHDASGLKGAGGKAGARDARKLDKLRQRK